MRGGKAAPFVEFEGRGVAAPNVERQVAASVLCGEILDRQIEGLADALAAVAFVDAQVVDIERLVVHKYVVVADLLEDAEGIAHERVVVVDGGQNGSPLVIEDRDELSVGVFSGARLEDVGTSVVVDHADLIEQVVDPVNILFLSLANLHGMSF